MNTTCLVHHDGVKAIETVEGKLDPRAPFRQRLAGETALLVLSVWVGSHRLLRRVIAT